MKAVSEQMSNFSSGLNGLDHAEFLRQKGLKDDKERRKKKRILKRDILSGALRLCDLYTFKLEKEFTRDEWAEILQELMKKNRKEQKVEDEKKIEKILRIGG